MGLPKDFDQKIPVTIGLIIWVAIISFSLGMLYKGNIDLKEEILAAREYTKQEIDGLRADWDRDRKAQEKQIDEIKEKFDD